MRTRVHVPLCSAVWYKHDQCAPLRPTVHCAVTLQRAVVLGGIFERFCAVDLTGICSLSCLLSPHGMRRHIVYCFVCVCVFVGHAVNEIDEIWQIDRGGRALLFTNHQDWWILAQQVSLGHQNSEGCKPFCNAFLVHRDRERWNLAWLGVWPIDTLQISWNLARESRDTMRRHASVLHWCTCDYYAITSACWNKNSSGDEIANMKFFTTTSYICRPALMPIEPTS